MGLLRPTGPEATEVYWRRRLVVLAVLVVVIVLLSFGVRALIRGSSDTADSPEPLTGTSPSVVANGTRVCPAESLTVSITADATSYPAGSMPVFTAHLTNSSEVSCLLEAGDDARQIVITSGSDRIWASADCATGSEPLQLLLGAGQADERTTQWNRTRSDETCSTGLPEPLPGTYQAVLTVSGVSSDPVVFQLD